MAECRETLYDEKLTDEQQILQLAKKIAAFINFGNWRLLGISLGLEEHQLQDISLEHVAQKPNILEVCYQIISQWQQTFPKKFSEKLLTDKVDEIQACEKISCITVSQEQDPSHKHKEMQKNLETAQLEAYKGIEMEIAPWMTNKYLPLDKLYVELKLLKTDKLGHEHKGCPMEIEEIFKTAENNPDPHRILIEGDAGFGKTTLLYKLVDDWTKKNNYIYQKFRNIFLFYLREINKDQSFEDLIRIECNSLDVNEEEGLKCIRTFEKETLFLLDGYDELSKDSKSKFEKLLLRHEFEHATIIVTSRRGEFQRDNENKIGTGLSVKHRTRKDHIYIWDKRILISGISEENRIKFLQKYLQIENVNKSLKQHFHIADKELFRCPLILILLATVKDEDSVQMIETQTDFYKFLLNVVTRRSLVRIHDLDESKDVELFDSNHENYHEECAKQMDLFGSLSIQHLIKDDLTFTHNEIEECCGKDAIFTKLGFISRRTSYKNWNRMGYYEPFHKSFLEFFAAFTLYRLAAKSEESNQDEFKNKISHLIYDNILPRDSSLIYPFLAGLLNDRGHVLFEAMSPWGCMWNVFKKPFINIIKEIKTPEGIMSSLTPFVPKHLKIDDSFSHHFANVRSTFILLLFRSFRFYKVNLDYAFIFPICTTNLTIQFESHVMLHYSPNPPSEKKFIQCDNLWLRFQKCEKKTWPQTVPFLTYIKFHVLNIFLNESTELIPLFHKEMTEGFWSRTDVDVLRITNTSIRSDTETYRLLYDLLQKKRIKNIFYGASFLPNEPLLDKCADFLNWECVSEVAFDSPINAFDLKSPLSRLFQTDKKWKYVRFSNLFNYSLPNSSFRGSVHEMELCQDLSDVNFEFVIEHFPDCTSLICDQRILLTDFTQFLLNLKHLRIQYSKLKTQTLPITDYDFSKLLKLPQLRLLSIEYEPTFDSVSWPDFLCVVKQLDLFLMQANLEHLDLACNIGGSYTILDTLTKIQNESEISCSDTIKDIQKQSLVKLKSLSIHWELFDCDWNYTKAIEAYQTISSIKRLLRQKFVKKIILYGSTFFLDSSFCSFLVSFPLEGFLISEGTEDDIEVLYFDKQLKGGTSLIITLPDSGLD